MKRQDLIDFAQRPWQLLADSGTDHWLAANRELGPPEGLRIEGHYPKVLEPKGG